jgi:hypothetical protein
MNSPLGGVDHAGECDDANDTTGFLKQLEGSRLVERWTG